MLLVKNARILTMTGTDYDNGYILVNNGKIVSLGENTADIAELMAGEEAATLETIDAEGKYVLPGFIDAHCHVGICEDSVGFEGEDVNEMTDPIMPHLRAIDGIYHLDRAFAEARENGVTTVVTGPGSANVIGGQFTAMKTYGRSVDEMIIKDPVAMKIAFGENPKTVYHEKHQAPTTRMATAALLRESIMKAREYKQLLDNYKMDSDNNEKPELDIKHDAMIKVLNREIPLKAHVHRADDILTAVRIAKEFNLKITLEHCTEGHLIADALSDEKMVAVAGPVISDRSKIELRNHSVKSPGILSKAGLKVAIMTDHPCLPVQYLCLSAAIAAREGMEETEALKAITINAAEITGIDDRVGSLAAGKDADIVIYDGHPFDLRTKVQYTIINGRVIYKC
ncbi:MAG: amidohydrolase [Clostridiales bacterium]|nr:amidohydrolase [Clostridiales bacterium]